MLARTLVLSVAAPLALFVAGAGAGSLLHNAGVQDAGKAAPTPPSQDAMPPMPQPTKEHAWLKGRAGNWDCTVHMMGQTSKATDRVRMLGEFWQVAEFSGDMGGAPFQGLHLLGYDPERKVFVSRWIDSMSPRISESEGRLEGNRLVSEGDDVNMEGKRVRMVHVTEVSGDDAATHRMYEKSKGQDDPMGMRIEYTRRK